MIRLRSPCPPPPPVRPRALQGASTRKDRQSCPPSIVLRLRFLRSPFSLATPVFAQARPRAGQPAHFELHADHRPPDGRNAAECYREPNLFARPERPEWT